MLSQGHAAIVKLLLLRVDQAGPTAFKDGAAPPIPQRRRLLCSSNANVRSSNIGLRRKTRSLLQRDIGGVCGHKHG